jgi:hypothetical protein
MSSPTGQHEQSKGDQAPGGRRDNPLLAFGSETGDPPSAEWVATGAKSGLQRLAEMSWRADAEEAAPSASARRARTLKWTLIPALVLACVLVAAFLYTEPVYSPIVLYDVAHPRATVDMIQPIPVPPPSATPEFHPAQPPARPATAATTRRRPISPPPAPAPSRSDSAALNPSEPAAVVGLGSLSINARPWADIWIDGKAAGQTPIANLQVTLGTHEVLFRHPLLGEQRHTVQVSGLAPTRIAVDLRN